MGSHKVVIAQIVVSSVDCGVNVVVSVGDERNLALSCLGLLASLVCLSLLLQLLVAESRQTTGSLLDL